MATQATFYNADTKERKAFDIGSQPAGFSLEQKIAAPADIPNYNVTHQADGVLYGVSKQPTQSTTQNTSAPVFNRGQIESGLRSSLATPEISTKLANQEFINAATRATMGRNATPEELAKQMTVGDAVKAFKLEKYAPNMGIGFGEVKTPVDTSKVSPVISAIDQTKSALEQRLQPLLDISKYQQESQSLGVEVEKARQVIADKQLIDAATLKQMEGQPILLSMISKQQQKYSNEQQLQNLMDTQDYNNKLILAKMAEGNFLEAQNINKDIANDMYEIQKLQIDKAREENRINENEQARLDQQARDERELALDRFIKITGPSGLKGLTENQIMRVPNPITGVEDIYKRPVEEVVPEYQYTAEGIFNKTTGQITPLKTTGDRTITTATGGGVVSTSTGDSYDISSYATDPNHEAAVQSILNNIGRFYTVQDIDNYIEKVSPKSPITGAMVVNTSRKYGVSWETLVAMMQQDSSLGTAGKGARTFNPGNIGNNDRGDLVNYGNWQSGVDAVGNWLSGHKTSTPEISKDASGWVENIAAGRAKISDVPAKIKTEVSNGLTQKMQGEVTQSESNKQEAYRLVTDMINDPSRALATGASSFMSIVPGSGAKTFANKVERLLGILTLDNIKQMRGMGALSDAEGKRLEQSAAILKDRSINENDYLKELERVRDTLRSANTINTSALSDEEAYQLYLQVQK